jgi:hypothetical protein
MVIPREVIRDANGWMSASERIPVRISEPVMTSDAFIGLSRKV